jgi:hypothetical protein
VALSCAQRTADLPKPYSDRRLEGLNENDLPSNRILHSFLKILESSSICLSMAADEQRPRSHRYLRRSCPWCESNDGGNNVAMAVV